MPRTCLHPGCDQIASYRRNDRWSCCAHLDPVDYINIRLTKSEADLWDWACDPMHEFWSDTEERRLDGDFAYDPGVAIREAVDGIGQIANVVSVANDLIYRITTQMRDMAIEQGGFDSCGRADLERMSALRDIAVGARLAAKVRRAFGLVD